MEGVRGGAGTGGGLAWMSSKLGAVFAVFRRSRSTLSLNAEEGIGNGVGGFNIAMMRLISAANSTAPMRPNQRKLFALVRCFATRLFT